MVTKGAPACPGWSFFHFTPSSPLIQKVINRFPISFFRIWAIHFWSGTEKLVKLSECFAWYLRITWGEGKICHLPGRELKTAVKALQLWEGVQVRTFPSPAEWRQKVLVGVSVKGVGVGFSGVGCFQGVGIGVEIDNVFRLLQTLGKISTLLRSYHPLTITFLPLNFIGIESVRSLQIFESNRHTTQRLKKDYSTTLKSKQLGLFIFF